MQLLYHEVLSAEPTSEQYYMQSARRRAIRQAADAIRDAILAGRIPADARIAELDLTRRLSVSRTLIREALSRLRPRASSS
jgi:DNA-binding GntR family transcriptional regulator